MLYERESGKQAAPLLHTLQSAKFCEMEAKRLAWAGKAIHYSSVLCSYIFPPNLYGGYSLLERLLLTNVNLTYLVHTNRLAINLDHVHDLDCVVRVVFAHELDKPVTLVLLCDAISGHVYIHCSKVKYHTTNG